MGSLLEKMLSRKGCGMPAKVKDSCAGEGNRAEKNTAFIPFPSGVSPEALKVSGPFYGSWHPGIFVVDGNSSIEQLFISESKS